MYNVKEIVDGKIEFSEFDAPESLVTLFPEGCDYLKDRTVTYKGKKYLVEKYTTNGFYTDDILTHGDKAYQLKECLKIIIAPVTTTKASKSKGDKGGDANGN